ncbi:hypothetical protein [Serratia marcescens]|uniref:hypothetical protein n=1 Tax=Serratia marcescens TaxID=615 RepID=UPI0006ECE266|nr:hypothetical protein [Serratia marcescens]ALL37838.1 hypothetical protein AR325_13025 [Serratia marcescens]PHI48425.1 hypothetical protein B9T65_14500 [Serratia marcescens]UJA56308.1 hypothetical protein L1F17_10580 [Serratia marcescens]
MKPVTKQICGVTVFPLVAVLQQLRRWWSIRGLRIHWADDQDLRRIARERNWVRVLTQFNIEARYRFIKLLVTAEQQRGIL